MKKIYKNKKQVEIMKKKLMIIGEIIVLIKELNKEYQQKV